MKTRIITGVSALAALVVVLALPWTLPVTLVTSLLCGVAMVEVFSVTGMIRHRALEIAAVLFAVVAPFFAYLNEWAIGAVCLLYLVVLVLLRAGYRRTVSVKKLVILFSLSLFIALALSCLSYLRNTAVRDGADGLFYIVLAMAFAWLSDTGAYFVGTFLGKHKLFPRLSPKKTVEGFIGGIVISVLLSMGIVWIYDTVFLKGSAEVMYGELWLLSLLCAPLSVAGDLFASLIKRLCGAKDYGNLFPGHGGVMDRFDSLLFVLPTVYVTVLLCPPIR